MADPSKALHKALLAKLNELTTPVYDGVPQGSAYPYITIDSSIAANIDALVERTQERFVYLNVWSESRGQAEVLGIIADIYEKLHGVALTLDTGTAVPVRVEQAGTQRDADNVTFIGNVTLRIITQH